MLGLHPYWFFFCFIFENFLIKLLNKALVTDTLIGDNVACKGYDCLCDFDFNFEEALTLN